MEKELSIASSREINAALRSTRHVYAFCSGEKYQIDRARMDGRLLRVRRVSDYQWIIPERVIQGLPSPPLSAVQRLALTFARIALEAIDRERVQEWSEMQERVLCHAYDTLSYQCSPIGVGIAPPGDYTPAEIFRAAAGFKRELDERYPEWRSQGEECTT
jgi:hypothetical protein